MKTTKQKPTHLRRLTAVLVALAVMLSVAVSVNFTADAAVDHSAATGASTYKIIFHVNNPELENKNVVFRSIGNDELNADYSLTHFYAIPSFAGDEYVFQGWYHNAGYTKSAADADIPVDFDSVSGRDTFPSRGSDYHIYAKWIAVGTVDKAAEDVNSVDSYRGFGLAGVQIREEGKYDTNTRDSEPGSGTSVPAPGGLRFITSVKESLLSDIVNIAKIPAASADATDFGVKYGYVVGTANNISRFLSHYDVFDTASYRLQYNDANVNGTDTTGALSNAENDYRYIKNVECTSKVNATASSGIVQRDHKNYDDYRLYTLVVTYDGEDESQKDAKIDARSYLQYYDANGKQRVFYNDYTNSEGITVFGGCMCSYNQVVAGVTNEVITWHQCPEPARNYIEYMEEHPYTEGDYSYTSIYDFAPTPENRPNTKPIGYTIDGVTFNNYVPNVAVPYFTESSSGTIMCVDRLRWINTTYAVEAGCDYPRGTNTRDIGGWSCGTGVDGKLCTVKYGMIYRGGEPNAADTDLMVNKLGIRSELQTLPKKDQKPAEDRLLKSVWGIDWYGNDTESTSVWTFVENDVCRYLWKTYLGTTFDSVAAGKPIYIHCGIGADRTGSVLIVLEAILGMSDNEICQDYELTTFAHYNVGNQRRRDNSFFGPFINQIKSVPLAAGLSDTLQNHAISYALSLGLTREQIDAFRNACIDGNPEQLAD